MYLYLHIIFRCHNNNEAAAQQRREDSIYTSVMSLALWVVEGVVSPIKNPQKCHTGELKWGSVLYVLRVFCVCVSVGGWGGGVGWGGWKALLSFSDREVSDTGCRLKRKLLKNATDVLVAQCSLVALAAVRGYDWMETAEVINLQR